MLSRTLYAILFAFLLDSPSGALASDAQQSLLGNQLGRTGQVKSVLEHEPVTEPACKQFVSLLPQETLSVGLNIWYVQPTGPIETTQCDFETVESVTDTLYDELHSLVETPFFKYFRVCRAPPSPRRQALTSSHYRPTSTVTAHIGKRTDFA